MAVTKHDPVVPTSSPLSPARQWLALAVLVLPVLLVSVDNTVLGFAVPALSADLEPSSTELLWIADAYAFVLAGLLVTMGHLGDRIGRRRLLLIGAVAFGGASLFAAFATSPLQLIAARALLGVGGATLMPSTLSLLRNIFDDPARRRTAIAMWASTFAVGGALGPLVGGWLLEHFWWGSVFLMNLPAMGLLLIAAPLAIPESRDPDPGRFDVLSSPLSLLAILPIVYALKHSAEHGPDLVTLAVAVFGAAFTVAFVRRQRRIQHPMLDVSLFANRTFSLAIGTNFVANIAMIGGIYFLAQHLQLVVGLEPLAAGTHLVPGMVAAGTASLLVVPIVRRGVPITVLIATSLVVSALGYLSLLALGVDDGGGPFALAMVLVGLGVGAATSLGSNLVMAAVPAERAGSASAVSETAFELGAATGIAVLGSTLTAVYRRSIDVPVDIPPDVAAAAGQTIGGALDASRSLDPGPAGVVVDAARQAFTDGLHTAALVAVVLLVGAAVAATTLRRAVERDAPGGISAES